MKDIVTILESLGSPVYRQGSLISSYEYDDSFFTYWNYETPEDKHFDDEPTRAVWGYWIYFYSKNINLTYSKLEEARKLLIQNGFVSTNGKGQDTASDVESHTGRMIDMKFIENY